MYDPTIPHLGMYSGYWKYMFTQKLVQECL